MAQRVVVEVTDDFDSTPGASTIKFGLDGTEYEVDLSPEHEQQFREFLTAYVGVGRKVTAGGGSRRVRRTVSSGSTSGSENNRIREWAAANGYTIGGRGRIPQEVKDAYHAAQGASAPAPTVDESAGVDASAVPQAEAAFSG